MKKSLPWILLAFSWLLVACPADPTPPTPSPRDIAPSRTPRPQPSPTHTSRPQPTFTPSPTQTPINSDIKLMDELRCPSCSKTDDPNVGDDFNFRLINSSFVDICELYIAPEGREWSQNLLTQGPMVSEQYYDTGPVPKGNTRLWVEACDGRHINKELTLYSTEGRGVEWEIFDFP